MRVVLPPKLAKITVASSVEVAPHVGDKSDGALGGAAPTALHGATAHAATWSAWVSALAPRGPVALLGPAAVEQKMLALQARGVAVQEIGRSQEGRALYAGTVGHGPVTLTVMAAAHPDEPVGTLTALHLLEKLGTDPRFAPLLERITLHVVPCANPDGAARNEGWFSSWDHTPDLRAYFSHVARDLPRDDVEFGFPEAAGDPARPENQALATWLAQAGHVDHHASLHSMFLGGGALFLVTASELEPHRGTLRFLLGEAQTVGMPLHDKDRMGQKGFFRIGPGLQTAPTAEAMRAFFAPKNGAGSQTTAQAFKLNSMQSVAQNQGCPFSIVSEIPLVYDPRISSNTPSGTSRAAEEERLAEGLLAMADRVQVLLEQVRTEVGASAGLTELDERLASVRTAAQAQAADLGRYGELPATEGIVVENDLNLLRREATLLASLARHLGQGPAAMAVNGRFDALVDEIQARFKLRFPPLEVQMRLQVASVLAGALAQQAPPPMGAGGPLSK